MERVIPGTWPLLQPAPAPEPVIAPDRPVRPTGGDAELVARLRGGDDSALEAVVRQYQGPVVAYLQGMLGERDDALDAAQEVFIRIHSKAGTIEPDSSLKAWTYRVATNVAIDVIRRRRRWRWLGLEHADGSPRELPDPPATGAAPSALDDVIRRERAAAVRKALATLPERYRAVLSLRDLEDLSYEEIAEVLAVSVGTVKSRVNRARNLLREKLSTFLGEENPS